MHTVTVTETGDGVHVLFEHSPAHFVAQEDEATTEELDEGPSPIAPEPKELLWAFGSFIVLLALMRLYLFPRLKKGMDARYGKIEADLEDAEATRAAAQQEVAEYNAALDAVKTEAAGRIEAGRHQLEEQRAARLAEANQRIAERRSAAAAEAEAARAAERSHIDDAVADVAALTVELSTGNRPDDAAVREAVQRVTGAGVAS
jgi:F-type H+-transporting ATPase subunit b